MNTYKIDDENFKNTSLYQNFINANPSQGFLKIRAYAASQALPISNLKIVVSKIIESNKIIFFEGITNSSGVIERIVLPAPKLDQNNLDAPNSTTYDIEATYQDNNSADSYKVSIYENIYVIQTINIVPDLNAFAGDRKWL